MGAVGALAWRERMAVKNSRTRRWILRDEPGEVPSCQEVAGLHAVLQQLLGQRGIVDDFCVGNFLEPKLKDLSDPFELPEMVEAVARVFEAVDQGQEICVYGDYDVDGITSITIMQTVLQAYGAKVRHFVPVRGTEGYGLSEVAIERCMREGPRPDLFITVDCGTVSHEPIEQLSGQGIDVIVVDHHERGEAGRPGCVALINPKFESMPLAYLCAAGWSLSWRMAC